MRFPHTRFHEQHRRRRVGLSISTSPHEPSRNNWTNILVILNKAHTHVHIQRYLIQRSILQCTLLAEQQRATNRAMIKKDKSTVQNFPIFLNQIEVGGYSIENIQFRKSL